jgi:cytoskeletal protein CcmA (bactofilin family)
MARASSSTASRAGGSTAVLGKGSNIRGRIAGDGDLRIEGTVSGDVTLNGDFYVAEGAEVVADVQASSVYTDGTIEGDITASGNIAIRASARVTGAIRGTNISIEEGASVSGRVEAEFELPPELAGKAGR